jgi:hypothetical protein
MMCPYGTAERITVRRRTPAAQGCFFFRVVGTLEPAVRTGLAGASAVPGDTANPPETGDGIAGSMAASSIMADACQI